MLGRRRATLPLLAALAACALPASWTADASGETLTVNPARLSRIATPHVLTDFAFGAEGELWLLGGEHLDRISQSGLVTAELEPPGGFGTSLTQGPNGTMWSNDLGYLTPPHTFHEVAIPPQEGLAVMPLAVAPGGAEHMWFTGSTIAEEAGHFVVRGYGGRVALPNHVEVFALGSGAEPRAIVQGSDGNGWYADGAAIGRLTPSGTSTVFPLPEGKSALALAPAPDGNVWFTAAPASVGRITPAGAIVTWPVPELIGESSFITAGPEGDLWFGLNRGQLGRVTPAGELTVFSGAGQGFDPIGRLAVAPDGALWFIEAGFGSAPEELIRMTIPLAPRASAPPAVSGSGLVGSTMSASLGSWEYAAALSVQWTICSPEGAACEAIPGATATTIPLTAGLAGHRLRAVVRASGEGGSAAAQSEPSALVFSPSSDVHRPPTFSTPKRVAALMSWRFGWSHQTHLTTVKRLLLERLTRGVTVEVLCAGGGCPFARHKVGLLGHRRHCRHRGHCTYQHTTAELASLFGGAHLKPHSAITVEVLHTGMVGKAFRFITRRGGVPRQQVGCLAVGSRKFATSC